MGVPRGVYEMNVLSAEFANQLWAAQVSWLEVSARVYLLRPSYTFDRLTPMAIVEDDTAGISELLTGLTVVDGWAKANPARFSGLAPGLDFNAVAIVREAADPLVPIIYMDELVGGSGLTLASPFWLSWQVDGIVRL